METPKHRASMTSSASETQRRCPSIFAMVSRSMSQPIRWHFAAKAGRDSPAAQRSRRTCGPMMLRERCMSRAGFSTGR